MRATIVRGFAALALAIGMALLPGAGSRVVVACSCAGSDDPIDDAAVEPAVSVFAGIVQPPAAGGNVPLVLTRWFKGLPPAAIVLLDGSSLDTMCGIVALTPGQEWIFVAGSIGPRTFAVDGCAPQGLIGERAGDGLLAAAIDRFGAGDLTPSDADGGTASPRSQDMPPIELIVGGTLAAAVLVLGAVVVLARRGSGDPERPPG